MWEVNAKYQPHQPPARLGIPPPPYQRIGTLVAKSEPWPILEPVSADSSPVIGQIGLEDVGRKHNPRALCLACAFYISIEQD